MSPQKHDQRNNENLNNPSNLDGIVLNFCPHVGFYSSYILTNFDKMSKSRSKICYTLSFVVCVGTFVTGIEINTITSHVVIFQSVKTVSKHVIEEQGTYTVSQTSASWQPIQKL